MITIVDYGMGNLGSIQNMLKKIGVNSEISSSVATIESAERIILPGVGSFDKAISNLESLGLIEPIKKKAAEGTPILGICLGMQLLANGSEEGKLPGLGIIPGKVVRFHVSGTMKIPHMGWNVVKYKEKCPLYTGFDDLEEVRFYFVHSYHYTCDHEEDSVGTTTYGNDFTSSIQRQNVYGAQFHPEKSHRYGMRLLKNFSELC